MLRAWREAKRRKEISNRFFNALRNFIDSRHQRIFAYCHDVNVFKSQFPLVQRRWKIIASGMLAFVFVWSVLPARPYHRVELIPAGIVDMHCHVAGIGAGASGCFISPKLRDNWRFKIYLRAFGVKKTEVLEKGDVIIGDHISAALAQSRYVRKAVILALDGVVDASGRLDTNRTEIYVPDQFVAEVCARHTNLLFGASVNPYRLDAIERLVWAKAHGAVLVKWIPPIMDINPDDPKLEPFYRKLVELDLPLLCHTGEENSFSRANDQLGDPEKLRLPLSLGVKVIAAHIASSETFQGERGPDRLARLMREFTDLYSDISALTDINKPGYLRQALTRPEFAGRLLYGTDYPLINTALDSPWYWFRLSLRQKWQIWRTKNPWDRDVLTKHYLGVPTETFAHSAAMFGKAN